MREELLSLLACPITGEPLEMHALERSGDEILGGNLSAGGRRYPIINGVPCFLNPEQQIDSKEGFHHMWQYRRAGRFESRSIYGIQPERKADWVETKFEQPFVSGGWVMDAGCGSAELTCVLAKRHPSTQFVALDINDTVREVAVDARRHANLHFVQADVAHNPFRRGTFGHLFSLGVLHHAPDTIDAFRGAVSVIKPGGEMLVWLYPDPKESLATLPLYLIRDVYFLRRGHELPPPVLYRLTQLYALGLLPYMVSAYSAYKVASALFQGNEEHKVLDEGLSVRELFQATAFTLYDNLTPKYQHRHKRREVLSWYRALGFPDPQTDGHGTYWGRRSERPAEGSQMRPRA